MFGAALGRQLTTATAQSVNAPTRVTGTLILAIGETVEIALPDQTVVLRREGRDDVNTGKTGLDGRFDTLAPTPGNYQICWEIGGSKECGKRFQVGRSTVWAGLVRARVSRPIVHGVVLTGDRRPCWVNNSFFGLDVSTRVTGGGFSARANVKGEYALIGPAPGTFRVTARCENANSGATVTLGNSTVRQDLPLANRAPHLTGLSAGDGTKALTRVAGGQSLKLIAGSRDRDGDVIEYVWRTIDPTSGSLAGSNGPTEEWKLSAADGLHNLYVMARDGKGGYAFKRFDMQVGPGDLVFSGRVIDEVSMTPVRNANVTLGSATTSTNASGWFSIRSAPVADDRYVLNIAHPNYALVSRVYDRSYGQHLRNDPCAGHRGERRSRPCD